MDPQIYEFLKQLSVAWYLEGVKTLNEMPVGVEKKIQATENRLRNWF